MPWGKKPFCCGTLIVMICRLSNLVYKGFSKFMTEKCFRFAFQLDNILAQIGPTGFKAEAPTLL
jgi:hypothetical protein